METSLIDDPLEIRWTSSQNTFASSNRDSPEAYPGSDSLMHNRSNALHKSTRSPPNDPPIDTDESTVILLQPDTRPIAAEQLVNEVKGIYSGLVMVEKKCVEITVERSSSNDKLNNDQWQALIALHRTLLHEHHDFSHAFQRSTDSLIPRRPANKYAMPARVWRNGIHAFLELLCQQLAGSYDHMFAFVYIAYSIIALLKQSVPSFLDTWIECLGDLARYRMAIEEIDMRDREIWSNVARMWYNKAADRSPCVGRIHHPLAVPARRALAAVPLLRLTYCFLFLSWFLPVAAALPVDANPSSDTDVAEDVPSNVLQRLLALLLAWAPSLIITALFLLYVVQQAMPSPIRVYRRYALAFAIASVGLLDLRTTPQIRYPTMGVGLFFHVRYALALFPDLLGRLGLTTPLLAATLVLDGFLCKLSAPSQGVDTGLFVSLLLPNLWLVLTSTHEFPTVFRRTRRYVARALDDGGHNDDLEATAESHQMATATATGHVEDHERIEAIL